MTEVAEKTTYCRICEVYCGLVATVEDGKVTKLRPDADHVVSRGYSCPKGLNAHQVTHDPDRILHPMKKRRRRVERISWEQAIGEIAAKLNAHPRRARAGRDRALHRQPGGLRVRAPHLLARTASRRSAAGTPTARARRTTWPSSSPRSSSTARSFLQPIPDLARTRHLSSSAPTPSCRRGRSCTSPTRRRRLREIRARGGKIVVIDPRRTETAELADEHHFIRPDTDAFLFLAMMHDDLRRRARGREFLAAHATDVDWLRAVGRGVHAGDGGGADRHRRRDDPPARARVRRGRRRVRVRPRRLRPLRYARRVGARGAERRHRQPRRARRRGLLRRPRRHGRRRDRLGLDGYGEHRSRVGDIPASSASCRAASSPTRSRRRARADPRARRDGRQPRAVDRRTARRSRRRCGSSSARVALDIYMSETAALADYVLPRDLARARGLSDLPRPAHDRAVRAVDGGGRSRSRARRRRSGRSSRSSATRWALPFLNSRAAAPLRRALRLVGRDFSPRWLIDGMIRLGPLGDRYLPWRDGLNLAKLAGASARRHRSAGPHRHPRARSSARPTRASIWDDAELEAELARLAARRRRRAGRVPAAADRPARPALEQQLAPQRPEAHARRPLPAAAHPSRRRDAARPRATARRAACAAASARSTSRCASPTR